MQLLFPFDTQNIFNVLLAFNTCTIVTQVIQSFEVNIRKIEVILEKFYTEYKHSFLVFMHILTYVTKNKHSGKKERIYQVPTIHEVLKSIFILFYCVSNVLSMKRITFPHFSIVKLNFQGKQLHCKRIRMVNMQHGEGCINNLH